MAEASNVNVGENSPEQVAYKLMHDIARSEKITMAGMGINSNREWIIRTYCQCLLAVKASQMPDDIVKAPLNFIKEIGMMSHLAQTRSNGLLAMVKQMKNYALAFKLKANGAIQ